MWAEREFVEWFVVEKIKPLGIVRVDLIIARYCVTRVYLVDLSIVTLKFCTICYYSYSRHCALRHVHPTNETKRAFIVNSL